MIEQKMNYNLVRELFGYNKKTGELIRRVNRGGNGAGSIAGRLNNNGYWETQINGKLYLNHRIVFLYHRGYMPENGLDHINRVRDDNRIENLREVSQSCNMRNAGDRKDNTSGIKGVCWHKRDKKWHAQICINKKKIHLGYYQSKLNAAIARHNAEVKYNFATCNTFDSSSYKYIMENQ